MPVEELSAAYPVELTGVKSAGTGAGGRVEDGLADWLKLVMRG